MTTALTPLEDAQERLEGPHGIPDRLPTPLPPQDDPELSLTAPTEQHPAVVPEQTSIPLQLPLVCQAAPSPDGTQPLYLSVSIGGNPACALVDSGAAANIMSAAYAKLTGIPTRTHTAVNVVLADGSKHTCDQYAPHVSSRLSSDRRCPRHYADFLVLDVALPGGDVIYGMPYLAAVNPSINWKSRTITLATPNGPLDIHSRNTQPFPEHPKGLMTLCSTR
jgi:hypothetical protein